MLYKTQGIVLSHIKYRETSIIVKIFTKDWGFQSFIMNGLRTPKPRHSMALFQSLTLLDMVVYYKKQRNLQRIAELTCNRPNNHILQNIKKTAIAVFLADFLTQVLHKEERNEPLFKFLWQKVTTLEEQASNYELFHLSFVLQLCRYLGFGISTAEDIYTQLRGSGHYYWPTSEQAMLGLNSLLANNPLRYTSLDKPLLRELMEILIKFYQFHTESLDSLPSLRVLQEIS